MSCHLLGVLEGDDQGLDQVNGMHLLELVLQGNFQEVSIVRRVVVGFEFLLVLDVLLEVHGLGIPHLALVQIQHSNVLDGITSNLGFDLISDLITAGQVYL